MAHEREHLRHLAAYVPGFQPGAGAIKLNTNENPFPPSPNVMAALAQVLPQALQRYPDPTAQGFRRKAARHHGVSPGQIVATNGGDELLRLALTTFVDPGRAVGLVTPSYGVYSVVSRIHRAKLCKVPLGEGWLLPEETALRWNEAGARLGILTNPHAPSGALFPPDTIERLAATFDGVLLIDEAYVDFVDPALKSDTVSLVGRYPNVLLLRTFSKGYSLAGLRVAYGIGVKDIVAPMLGKTKDSYNVDALAQLAAEAALDDVAYAAQTWDIVRHERIRLSDELRQLGFDVSPSQANFVLASMPDGGRWQDAGALHAALQAQDIHVRWFDEDRLRNRLRISVGTGEENSAVLKALADLL